MTGQRERLEVTTLVLLFERVKNERVPDRVIERLLRGADKLLCGGVQTLPFGEISLIVAVGDLDDLRELNLAAEARRRTCPVGLRAKCQLCHETHKQYGPPCHRHHE
jgi:hypothetical protein